MKNLTNVFVIIFMITPLFCFSQVEENASSGQVKLEGSVGADASGVYFISEDCRNNGKFYFSPILPTDTDDKKINKKNAKSNKKTQKKIDKYAKFLGGNILTDMTVTCLMGTGDNKGKISFGNLVGPITEPKEISTTPAANALNKSIFNIAVTIAGLKESMKIISFAGEEVNGVESVMTYYYGPDCQLIKGMPNDAIKAEVNLVIEQVLASGLLVTAELLGIEGKVKAAKDEVKSLKPPANIAAGAANAQAILNIAKLTSEIEGLVKNATDLQKSLNKANQL